MPTPIRRGLRNLTVFWLGTVTAVVLTAGCSAQSPPGAPTRTAARVEPATPASSGTRPVTTIRASPTSTRTPTAPPTAPQKTAPSHRPQHHARPPRIEHRLPDGLHYGFVKRVAGRDVTIDVIDWFSGAAATKACKEDGVPVEPEEWCNDYYYRNRNPLLRTFPLPRDMSVTVLSLDTAAPYRVSVHGFATRFHHNAVDRQQPFHFTTRAGRITSLEEQFTP